MIQFIPADDGKEWYATSYDKPDSKFLWVYCYSIEYNTNFEYILMYDGIYNDPSYYKVEIVEIDIDRGILKLNILYNDKEFNITTYRRGKILDKLLS